MRVERQVRSFLYLLVKINKIEVQFFYLSLIEERSSVSKPWYSSYESGVPHEIDVTSYSSIVEILEEGFAKYSTLPAFHCLSLIHI